MTTSISAGGSACCPVHMGEVCWNNAGATRTAFAVFDPVSDTMSYTDTVTGAPVAQGLIIACPDASAWTTVNAVAAFVAATGAGATGAGLSSVTITNVGTTNGTVLGTPIVPGETVTFTGYADPVSRRFVRLPAISYVGTATATLHIATLS